MASNRVFAAMPQLDVDLYTIIDRTYIRLENRHPILTGVLIIMVGTTVNTILDTRRAIAALFA